MVAFPFRQRLIVPLAPLGGGVVGALFALIVLVAPAALIESAVGAIGLPAVLAAAQPPLGATARALLACVAGVTGGILGWGVAFMVVGRRTMALARSPRQKVAAATPEGASILRRGDAHPDAPPRRPLMAAEELGTPFLEVRAPRKSRIKALVEAQVTAAPAPPAIPAGPPPERALPIDLDAPLAAFDPAAIPAEPAEPVRAVAPLARMPRPDPVGAAERIEVFDLTPPPAAAPASAHASIAALLERLERGVSHRKLPVTIAPPPPPAPAPRASIEDSLAELRRLATAARA